MPQYTTGEIAKLCNVSVRTVQFYDTKDLLKPTELTVGGRRLYSEDDLKKLQFICLLKSLGLSLDSIRGIANSGAPEKILLLLLDEQEKEVCCDIRERQRQLRAIRMVKEGIREQGAIPVQTISDIERAMNSRNKLRRVHGTMLAVGILMDVIEIGTLLLWILRGIWLPFAVGMPIVIAVAVMLFRMYHRQAAYICAQCNAVFQPTARAMLFSKHTAKTRKLKCSACGHTGFCVETAAEQ